MPQRDVGITAPMLMRRTHIPTACTPPASEATPHGQELASSELWPGARGLKLSFSNLERHRQFQPGSLVVSHREQRALAIHESVVLFRMCGCRGQTPTRVVNVQASRGIFLKGGIFLAA